MKRLSTLALALAVSAALTAVVQAQIKNVLLEQHTGAWCGWCPDGTVMVDEIVALYGRRVIGVKIHNGDAMEIPEESVIGDALGLEGFPTASVNRESFGGIVFLDRGDWQTACETQMRQRAKAEVDCFYTLDRTTRVAKIQIVANIVEAMSLPLKFNAFVVEDDVTGTGSSYDQHNYLSGRAGYENNPYYKQPSVLVGYHHMKVVRKMLGGAWGVAGPLPAAVKPGERYTHTFQVTLDTKWNLDKLSFVGMLQADTDTHKEIVNSAWAVKDGVTLNRIIDGNTPAMKVLAAGASLVKTYTLENATNQKQTYTVTVSTTARTPADWSAQFTSGTLKLTGSGAHPASGLLAVAAHATATLSLTLTIGSTLGLGDAQVLLDLQGTPPITRSRIVTAVTQEIQHLLLETGSDYSLRPYLANTACADAVTLEPSEYLAYAEQLTNVKVVLWNKGPTDGLSAEEVQVIRKIPNVNTLICGDHISGTMSADDLSYFGVQDIGWNMEAQKTTGAIWLSGQQGDVITGTWGSNIEGRLMYYYLRLLKILDSTQVFPILHYQNDGLRRSGNSLYPISAQDAIVGVRSTKNNVRTVFLTLSPYIIWKEQNRQTLVKNIIAWLTSPAPASPSQEEPNEEP